MGKRGLLTASLAVVFLGLLTWTILSVWLRTPEPAYAGKPLSYWLPLLDDSSTNRNGQPEGVLAIRNIGTNAIPVLLQHLRAHDIPLKTNLLVWAEQHHIPGAHYTSPKILHFRGLVGFYALGPLAASAVPDLAMILDQDTNWDSGNEAARILEELGPAAKAAVPALLRAAGTNARVRNSAIRAIAKIHSDSEAVIPFLIEALQNSDLNIRIAAAVNLGQFGAAAKPALPAMAELLNDENLKRSRISVGSHHSGYIAPSATPEMITAIGVALHEIDPEKYGLFTNALTR